MKGIKPLFLVEYGAPYLINWSWSRNDGGSGSMWFAAEWGAQWRGDAAYDMPDDEKRSARAKDGDNVAGVQAMYIAENFPAFRTWGVTMFNNWDTHYTMFNLRRDAKNPELTVDWDAIQRPGFSPDFVRTNRWDIGYEDADWSPNKEGQAQIRYNQPLLASIAGKSEAFTSLDHNFTAGETVRKQVIVINNSRRTVDCDVSWTLDSGEALKGAAKVTVATGEQARIPVEATLGKDVKPGNCTLTMTAKFNTGEVQEDTFVIHVVAPATKPTVRGTVGLYDPKGETSQLLDEMGVTYRRINPEKGLSGLDVLIIGKHALTLAEPKLDLSQVRDGLKVIVFEQTNEVLEQRLGFRTQEYCLRQVFGRVAGHPVLAGLGQENLHDWRGEGTTVPARLTVPTTDPDKYPQMSWCGFMADRAWRVGCRGSVATVLIEKPTTGDFLPLVDCGFSLQYAPLLEYREGKGMVLFCQLDVTGRTETDPAAQRLTSNLLGYVSAWKPSERRTVLYAGEPAGKKHLEAAGLTVKEYRGGVLKAEDVLVVGPGWGKAAGADTKAVQAWVKAGGRLLMVGLESEDANTFVPLGVTTKKADYIAGSFAPTSAESLLAGVGPADVYSRLTKAQETDKWVASQVPLVTGGAKTFADGVLAQVEGSNVVLLQLVPWRVDYAKDYNVKTSYRRWSFTMTRILANMGVAGEGTLLKHFAEPLPARAMLEDVPNVIWLEAGETDLLLPKVWKGLPLGKKEPPADWEKPVFDESGWRDIQVPGMWENQFADLINLDGLFLYRLTFDVPAELAGQEVTLVLGAVDDEDWTYVNGKFVGSITQQTNPRDYYAAVRRYTLAKGTLKPGRNVLAVKVNDVRQAGGLKASLLKRRGGTDTRWLTGLYLDEPVKLDDPYRYYRW